MKTIRPPVKVDARGRVIDDPDIEATQWRLNIPGSFNNGRKQRLFFSTEGAAKAKRDELLGNRKKPVGEEKLAQLAARGLTIEGAIDYAIAHAPLVATLTFGTLLDQFVQHRIEEVGVGERYLAGLHSYVKKLKDRFGKTNIRDIGTADLRDFLAKLKDRSGDGPAAADTRNHYIETLKAVYAFAKDQRYLADSPADPIKKKKTDAEGEVAILSTDEAAKLLEALALPQHAEIAPAALLQLFAAPRRSEIMHVTWEVVTEKYLRLDKVKRGTKKRRVEMPETLLQWLAPLRKASGYVFAPADLEIDRHCLKTPAKDRKKALKKVQQTLEDAYAWRLSQVAKDAEVTLPKNVLRHTAVTMRVNLTEDVAATAMWAGNSPAVIEEHYLGVATKDDAVSFYALRPAGGNVVAMTAPAAPVAPKGEAKAAG